MTSRRVLVVPLLVVLSSLVVGFRAQPAGGPAPTVPGSSKNFTLVGHDPLMNRGMNAAPALYSDAATGKTYVYVGSRTDGSHPNAGVLVVDVSDPAHPSVVNQIGAPNEALPTQTSRELRVWPQQKVLIVMNFSCSAILHACASPADVVGSVDPNFEFYDLSDPANPKLVATYTPSRTPHEMFLWVDPKHPSTRALLYISTPTTSFTAPSMIVTDISGWRDNTFPEIVQWEGEKYFPPAELNKYDVREHSMDVSPDGTRVYIAYLGGGIVILDSSELAAGTGTKLSFVSKPQDSPRWWNDYAHTAEKVPGRPLILATDEIYGKVLQPIETNNFGCPWGWVHMVDISDPSHPKIVGQFKTFENHKSYCATAAGQDQRNTYFTAYAAHNPTVLGPLAFVTWHSDGLQAIDIRDAANPTQAGFFSATPEPYVVTEDPALSMGENKVVAWSYPIIKDGLIYFVDVRNGLYIVKYTGPDHQLVDGISFLEGNSNLGDAARLEQR
jgi:hypothetical protein